MPSAPTSTQPSMAVICTLLMALTFPSLISAQNGPTNPFTSIFIGDGITHVTDSQNRHWLHHDNENWIDGDGQGVGISVYGKDRLAIAGTDGQLYTRGYDDKYWIGVPDTRLVIKTSGNSQGDLWFKTTDKRLWRLKEETIYNVDAGSDYQVVDFYVRDQLVYVIQGNQICARPVVLERQDRVCVSPRFTSAFISASNSNIFVMSVDGTLYSTKLPLTPYSTFFETGQRFPNARYLTSPWEGNSPVILDRAGKMQSNFCTSKCFDAPAKAPVQAEPAAPSASPVTPPAIPDQTTQTVPPPLQDQPRSDQGAPSSLSTSATLQSQSPEIQTSTTPSTSPQSPPQQSETTPQKPPNPQQQQPQSTTSSTPDPSTPRNPQMPTSILATLIALGLLLILCTIAATYIFRNRMHRKPLDRSTTLTSLFTPSRRETSLTHTSSTASHHADINSQSTAPSLRINLTSSTHPSRTATLASSATTITPPSTTPKPTGAITQIYQTDTQMLHRSESITKSLTLKQSQPLSLQEKPPQIVNLAGEISFPLAPRKGKVGMTVSTHASELEPAVARRGRLDWIRNSEMAMSPEAANRMTEIAGWTCFQVQEALVASGVDSDSVRILTNNGVNGYLLLLLSDEKLKSMGIEPLSARNSILLAINQITGQFVAPNSVRSSAVPATPDALPRYEQRV
ncbi:hypothetical protein HDU97_008799 [Phlyctochytrium planicorne]|nr:hypothetical protein HDU97_008799 [Phlyctochytrium planicorne]